VLQEARKHQDPSGLGACALFSPPYEELEREARDETKMMGMQSLYKLMTVTKVHKKNP
jgi:hypothetical protein